MWQGTGVHRSSSDRRVGETELAFFFLLGAQGKICCPQIRPEDQKQVTQTPFAILASKSVGAPGSWSQAASQGQGERGPILVTGHQVKSIKNSASPAHRSVCRLFKEGQAEAGVIPSQMGRPTEGPESIPPAT